MPETRTWIGEKPKNCHMCGGRIGSVFYDACLRGHWALSCHACFQQFQGKLGIGMGQKYRTKTGEKVAG